MKSIFRIMSLLVLMTFVSSAAWADQYSETKKMFEQAGVNGLFESAYGYALFPTIGKAGFVVGGAYGEGQVYQQGTHVGNTAMTQATIGFQIGGSGFSQVVFFKDERSLKEFMSGNFEFGADVSAVALTAAAGASANTAGSSTSASGGKNNANMGGGAYNKGMATFTITKGGLMYEASVGGQKFSYSSL